MATKHKMDRYLISDQPYEIRWVRGIFIKWVGDEPVHPTKTDIKALKKKFGKSRLKVYPQLELMGYTNVLKK